MKKVFDFIENLSQRYTDLLGFPTVKFDSSAIEVYFDSTSTIRGTDLGLFDYPCDEFRMFPSNTQGFITYVFTFYREDC